MTFLPEYENDIFISYAHVDNLITDPKEEGWVSKFHRHLEIRLSQRTGVLGLVKIWWDTRRLDGGVLFDQTIQKAIENSAILIALTSPGYLKSEYCRKELNLFYNRIKSDAFGLTVNNRPRILNLLLRNIVYETWPEEYGRTVGFEFYDLEDKIGIGEPSDPKSKLFEKQLYNLIEAIDALMNDFKREIFVLNKRQRIEDNYPSEFAEEVKKEKLEREDVNFIIYFADVSDSLRIIRNRIITDLRRQGDTVIENIPPPYESDYHNNEVNKAIEKADISIHLFDNIPGRYIEGKNSKHTYPQRQYDLITKYEKYKIVWLPYDLDLLEIQEITHKEFLKGLKSSADTQPNCHFIEGKTHSITNEICAKVRDIKNEWVSLSSKKTVLLDFHYKDYTFVPDIQSLLIKKGIKILSSPDENDPKSDLSVYVDRLKHSGSMIIFYGNVNEKWIIERVKTALQIILTEDCPTKIVAIYMPISKEIPKELDLILKLNIRDLRIVLTDNNKINFPEVF